jgi:hypothetical protein
MERCLAPTRAGRCTPQAPSRRAAPPPAPRCCARAAPPPPRRAAPHRRRATPCRAERDDATSSSSNTSSDSAPPPPDAAPLSWWQKLARDLDLGPAGFEDGSASDLMGAMDFAEATSPEEEAALAAAKEYVGEGGVRMTDEQSAALKKKIGGSYRGFFKEWVEARNDTRARCATHAWQRFARCAWLHRAVAFVHSFAFLARCHARSRLARARSAILTACAVCALRDDRPTAQGRRS